MSELLKEKTLSDRDIATAAKALRWAAFGGTRRGIGFSGKQTAPARLRFETDYEGRKAWVDLDIPYTPVSLMLAGALLLQQLNTYLG